MKQRTQFSTIWLLALVGAVAANSEVRMAVGQALAEVASAQARPPTFATPPAPALRPREAMQTIQLAAGYRIELVAADPVIQDPVAMTFDADGRIWVCEMRGFMPTIDGQDENAPTGVISVLHDVDGDGVMDTSTVYLDGLVLPRGLCWTTDGILVCENGTIWLCRDTDGDDRCDDQQSVCTYNRGNLEHALNGLMPALDNWVYNAKEGIRLRRLGGKWISEPIADRGQWGITQDNYGYLYYNVNASLLRGDLVPCYSTIAVPSNPLVDAQLYDEQEMFPIRPTPGINRGYIPGFLRPDGSLIEANSNCGPVVYRGDNLPPELVGNVFIPEPAGNLIRRQVLVGVDGRKTSKNAYDRREFLASTDERFRPVNMYNAPDGTLYVVDMYRGIIQHGAFITPYLREQILQRQLDREINLGRIYRVAHESTRMRSPVAMSNLSKRDLVEYLSSDNGWHRDMAQQLLVQRGDVSIANDLEQVATSGANPLGRLHALWTLEGLSRLDPELLYELLSDEDAHVRASAVTLYRRFLAVAAAVPTLVDDVGEVANDPSHLVRWQVVQTLGLFDSSQADRAIAPILKAASASQEQLLGVLSGFAGQEAEFLSARLSHPNWKQREPWRESVLSAAAGVMWRQRDPMAMLRFCHVLDSLPDEQSWQLVALMDGVKDPPRQDRRPRFGTDPATIQGAPSSSTIPADNSTGEGQDRPSRPARQSRSGTGGNPGVRFPGFSPMRPTTLRLDKEPEGIERMRQSTDARLAAAANALAEKLVWPGKDGRPLPEKRSLSDEQRRLFDLGRREYSTLCAACHHVAGYGLAAKGPQLLASPWLEQESRSIRIILHGLQGPVTVRGGLYNADKRLIMPGMSKILDDEKVAGILTYVRREFVNDAPPVEVKTVTELRSLLSSRTEPWTETELLQSAE